MPRTRRRYPPEFRQQMVELVAAGRSPDELATEFEPTAQTIRNWVVQAARDQGQRTDGPTTAELTELRQLRREVRQLKLEREILSKAAAWFARETGTIPDGSTGFVRDHQAVYPVATLCRCLQVSPSGFYAWRQRGLSSRAQHDQSYTYILPSDYGDRLATLPPFGKLRVALLGRSDIVLMKVYALRPRDVVDLRAIAPTKGELAFVRRHVPRIAVKEPDKAQQMTAFLDEWDVQG